MPDFIKSSTPEQRHELAMRWLSFWAEHQAGRNVDTSDTNVEDFIETNS